MSASSSNQPASGIVAAQQNRELALAAADDIFRIKCFLETGHTFVGWLYYYNTTFSNHLVGYTGTEGTPAGLRFSWYQYDGIQYLWDVDSLKGFARYLGPYEADDHVSGEINLWAHASGIRYNLNGDQRFRLWNKPTRYCYAAGSSYIYWGDYGEALQFELVKAG